MLFQRLITVTAGKTKASPSHTQVDTAVGKLTRVQVRYLAGCHNMVSLQIKHVNDVIVPAEHETALVGDDQEFNDYPNKNIEKGYETLDIYAWAPDTTYDHDITVTLTVVTPEEKTTTDDKIEELNKTMKVLGKWLGAPID
jgi:hypothetical protein